MRPVSSLRIKLLSSMDWSISLGLLTSWFLMFVVESVVFESIRIFMRCLLGGEFLTLVAGQGVIERVAQQSFFIQRLKAKNVNSFLTS